MSGGMRAAALTWLMEDAPGQVIPKLLAFINKNVVTCSLTPRLEYYGAQVTRNQYSATSKRRT